MGKKYWNPLGKDLPLIKPEENKRLAVALDQLILEKKKEYLVRIEYCKKKRPQILLMLLGVLFLYYVFRSTGTFVLLMTVVAVFVLVVGYFFIDIDLISRRKEFKKICSSILKSMLAQENGWRVEDNILRDNDSWKEIAGNYPLIFQRGDVDQVLKEMVWGFVGINDDSYPFWKTIFDYKVEIQTERGGVDYKENRLLVVAFKAKKKICDGYLLLKSKRSDWWNEDFNKVVDEKMSQIKGVAPEMEMVDFNEIFYLAESELVKKDDLEKIFSPVVQRNLVQFSKWSNGCWVYFQNDELWVVTEQKSLWEYEGASIFLDAGSYDNEYYLQYKEKIKQLLNNFREILDSFD